MGIEEQIDRLIDLGEDIRDSLNHLKVVRLRDALRAAGPKVFDAVADEPAKEPEPEHPPDPGEGYRLLSKNPPEELMPGDELQYINGTWVESDNARTHRRQGLSLWYRRKIEAPKPPEPEYREPVLPGDAGKYCQFSDDGIKWRSGWLNGWVERSHQWIARSGVHWQHARIKKDA